MGNLMQNKLLLYLVGGTLGYIIFAGSIMLFYKDDPTRMALADRQEFNRKYLANLSSGGAIRKNDVISYLDSPDITEAKLVNGIIYQVMFYRIKEMKADGITSKNECAALLFADGLLIANDAVIDAVIDDSQANTKDRAKDRAKDSTKNSANDHPVNSAIHSTAYSQYLAF